MKENWTQFWVEIRSPLKITSSAICPLGLMLEPIVKLNSSLPSLHFSRAKLSHFTEYKQTIDYFSSNLEQLSSKEKALLYRVLAILSVKDSKLELLARLELDLKDNLHRCDLSTILNFSIGADLVPGSTVYEKTHSYVYGKLMDSIKHLFVKLNVIRLTKKPGSGTEQETEYFSYLDKTFEILDVGF